MSKLRAKRIVILSGVQIIDNPRVVKEANFLAKAGYEVEVIGAIFDTTCKQRIQAMLSDVSWTHVALVDLSENGVLPKIDYLFARLRRKLSLLLFKLWNIESCHQLGYFVIRLFRMAKKRRADLYIVHMEQAMWVGRELIREGYKVATDMEDWHSEDGLPEYRIQRPLRLLTSCEDYLLKYSAYTVTTSKSLSEALVHTYHCESPAVVYNSFPLDERKFIDGDVVDRKNIFIPSIIWFSQTLGPGRGLEELIFALNKISSPFELHLRATDSRDYCRVLLDKAIKRTRSQIFVHPQVPQNELLSRISEHDIGFCGESDNCRNSDLTVSNKMMEYLRGGLAIIASDTLGHQEIKMRLPNAICMYEQGNINSLVAEIKFLFQDKSRLMNIKGQSLIGLQDSELSWEYSSQVLGRLVGSCFSKN